jgi:FkbM family methyltransferase
MSLMTSPLALRLRGALRSIGLTQGVSRLLYRGGAEDDFARSLQSAIRPGDVVWDVGANVGLYSPVLAGWVGDQGHVYAFEPSGQNQIGLRAACADCQNVVIFPFGLSAKTHTVSFVQGTDSTGATSRVVAAGEKLPPGAEQIELRAGDELIATGAAKAPNVVKIDVEGHECDVLEGLSKTLSQPALRDIFIEVHFALLQAAGRSDVPRRIERELKARGFKVVWCDPSHLHASR